MPVKLSDIMSSAADRIRRTEAYAEKVRRMFAQTVNDILALNKSMPELENGVMYSFDGDNVKRQKEVETMLRRLHSAATLAIEQGVTIEWKQANEECDKIVSSLFGKAVLSSGMFSAWTDRNESAMRAFISRSEKGMGLSDRVWQSVRQLRDEMEVAMTVGIGEGQSASGMSRKVRQYLNDPDLMFRRFRYKDDSGEWKLKWKKRVRDEKTGRNKWIDYDKDSYRDEWTGKGYYKSSAQNAMRVARTETNMAYRRADHERWQNMDFVLGQRVQLSRSHPRPDICDKLQGDYPKEFVFDGWHPQCYSDDSEVLTQQGWKLFAEVQDDDRILSLNPETREIEYVGIIDRQRYEREGDMVHFFNRSLDCLVTPEHQMVYLNKSDGRIERCRADEFRKTKGAFYRGCNHQDGEERSMIHIGSHCIDFDDYCEFMGYWLADGSLERNSGVAVAQKKGQELCNDILPCMERMGFNPKQRELYLIFYNSDFNAFLQRFGKAHDKYIPEEILSAGKRQIRIFLNAFVQCDGNVRKCKSFVGSRGNLFRSERNERMYYATSPRMAAQLGELLLKIGLHPSYSLQKAGVSVKKDGLQIKGNFDCWRIYECKAQTSSEFNKEIVPYSGYVYDLSLERNHIMYIRRNGKCFWGSNCFCYVTPVLIDEGEMAKYTDAIARGEEYTMRGKPVAEYPEGFREWVKEHAGDIAKARDRGAEPYFIRNNAEVIDNILNPKKTLTILEKAKIRHDARTAEQRQAIIDRWEARKKNPLTIAANRHAARTPEQVKAIKEQWASRQKKHALIKKTANNVLKVAQDYGEVDFAKLQQYISEGNLTAMQTEAKAVAQSISAMKKQETSLSALIPDAHDWHKQFSISDLQDVYDAVENKLKQWTSLTLEQQAKKLKFEAYDFLGGNMHDVQSKYKTWKVSQAAYIKKYNSVLYEIDYQAAGQLLDVVKKWSAAHPKSAKVANLVSEAEVTYGKKGDLAGINTKIAAAQAEMNKRIAEQARRDAKKNVGTIFGADAYTKARKDAAMWAKNTKDADKRLRDKCGDIWRNAPKEEKNAIYGYTESYHNINEPLRGLNYIGSPAKTQEGLKRIPQITKIIDKSNYDFDMWVQRGDDMVALKKFGLSNYNLATDTEVYALVGKTGTEGAFWSAGVSKGKGFHGDIIFNIYMPKGTKAMYCEPFSAFGHGGGKSWNGISGQSSFGYESEILLQRGTTFRITKVEKSGGQWYIDLEVIAQDVLPFPYTGGYPYK